MAAMARPPSDNVFQVSFKVPDAWRDMADAIAREMSTPGIATTRTDVLRRALWIGLEKLQAEHPSAPPVKTKKR
ncbi:MAG: hypothetical protein JWP97_5415 [Labilithrix sp.]|nr:hypothetical protein [Labilithrix sp.]